MTDIAEKPMRVTLWALRRRLNSFLETVGIRGRSLIITRYGHDFVTIDPIPASDLPVPLGEPAVPLPTGNSVENSAETPVKRAGLAIPRRPSPARPRGRRRKSSNDKDLR